MFVDAPHTTDPTFYMLHDACLVRVCVRAYMCMCDCWSWQDMGYFRTGMVEVPSPLVDVANPSNLDPDLVFQFMATIRSWRGVLDPGGGCTL